MDDVEPTGPVDNAPEQDTETEGFTGIDPLEHDAALAKINALTVQLAEKDAEIDRLKVTYFDKLEDAQAAASDVEEVITEDNSSAEEGKEYEDIFEDVDKDKD